MAITNIVVHPKGATHFQKLSGNTYFLKCIEGIWYFASSYSWSRWLADEILNDPTHKSFNSCKQRLTLLR